MKSVVLETAYTYGWRKGEMIGLRVSQLDLGMKSTMRLYDSKNGEGRVVPIMSNVLALRIWLDFASAVSTFLIGLAPRNQIQSIVGQLAEIFPICSTRP